MQQNVELFTFFSSNMFEKEAAAKEEIRRCK